MSVVLAALAGHRYSTRARDGQDIPRRVSAQTPRDESCGEARDAARERRYGERWRPRPAWHDERERGARIMARTEDERRVEADERLPPVVELTREEARALFDARAREWMGMSGEEFLRRYDAGEFDEIFDDPDHPEVLDLVMMRPFAR